MPIVFPPGITSDPARLAAVYNLVEQARVYHNSQGEIARSNWREYQARWITFSRIYHEKVKWLLHEQNILRDNIFRSSYSDRRVWDSLTDEEKGRAILSMYGNKAQLSRVRTNAASTILDKLLKIPLNDVVPGKIVDPVENLLAYTEVDPNNKITVTAAKSSWVDLTRNEDAYVYADKGVGHFDGDYEHLLEAQISLPTEQIAWAAHWVLANLVDDVKGIQDASGDAHYVFSIYHPTVPDYRLYLGELNGGTATTDYGVILVDTRYYLKVKRDEAVGVNGTLYCYIYSDAARTTLVDTLTVTLTEKQDFRYVYVTNTWNSAGDYDHDGFTENLDLQEAVAATRNWGTIIG